MKINEILSSSTRAFPSLEIVPPLRGMSTEELLRSIAPLMEFSPRYINVTRHREEYEFIPNPDGSFRRVPSRPRMSQEDVCKAVGGHYGVEVVPHIICGGVTRAEIEQELDRLVGMGISNVIALRGDCTSGEKRFTPTPGGYSYASELVEGIRAYRPEKGRVFSIGVGGYPEKHFEAPNIETDIENLKKKVEAGADYVITQMFFDNQVYYDFVRRGREAGITVPIIPGLKPISTARQVDVLPETFSLDIPIELTSAIKDASESPEEVYSIGTQWCIRQCRDLIANGVKAVHFYTMGKSRNICEILKNCF